MIKSRKLGKNTASYEDDPSEIKIDHNSGMPRAATKKRKVVKSSEDQEPVAEKSLALDGRPGGAKKRRQRTSDESSSRRTDIGPSSVAGAKRKAARLKVGIPTEEQLLDELPVVTTTQEQEHLDEYLHMFRKLRRLIRKAEKDCLETNNPRAYYAVCTLYSAQREVIADIRAVSDASGQVKYLDDHVLQPLTRSLGQNLLDVYYQVRKLIIETSNPKDTQFAIAKHEELIKEQGRFLQATYQEYSSKTSKYLLGDTK